VGQQIERFQSKLRVYTEQDFKIKTSLKEIEIAQESMLDKIEKCHCFGKIMFMKKPVVTKSFRQVKDEIFEKFIAKVA